MKLYKDGAALLIVSTLGLTACQSKPDVRPEVFNAIAQSEFYKNEAVEVPCSNNPDFPDQKFSRICFQVNAVTIPSEDKAKDIGLDLGLKMSAHFRGSDWEMQRENPEVLYYVKPLENGCIDKLFLDVNGIAHLNSNETNYPALFAPILTFSKLRKPECSER